MKKIHFLFLISFFTKTISSQQYFPLLDSINTWNYTTNYIPVRLAPPSSMMYNCNYPYWFFNSMQEFTTTDTIINSFTYKVVQVTADQNPTACHFGFVREDTTARKIYFRDNLGNSEILLYDFSMTINSTIAIGFIQPGYFQSGVFTLDSITSVYTNSGYHRAFHLNDHFNSLNHTLTWIEGIGNLEDAFYPYSYNMGSMGWYWNCSQFPHDNWQFMTCFDHDYKVYYDSCARSQAAINGCIYYQDTCSYWNICSSIQEYSSLNSLTIFPNPSSGKTMISLDVKHSDNFEIIISNISGKKICEEISLRKIPEGKKEIELDLSSLANGMYLVECRSENGSVYRKLLIEKQ